MEEQNKDLVSENDSLRDEISAGRTKESNLEKELSKLRERMNVSQQNWVREREEGEALRKSLYNEIDVTRQSMQDWEVLAMEESSVRKALSDRCAELEEQLASQREMYEAVLAEKNKESSAVESLQNAIQHLQIGGNSFALLHGSFLFGGYISVAGIESFHKCYANVFTHCCP